MSDLPPPSCPVGFKEWAGVCHALATGAQTLILRKGGIAEEGGVFKPEHRAFWLYPTRLHESQQGLRNEAPIAAASADPAVVPILSLAVVDSIHLIEREEDLAALEPFHIWTDETVRKRFHYRRPGVWTLGVRVWNLPSPFELVATPEMLGCKTWVDLEMELSTAGVASAIEDAEWRTVRERLLAAVGSHRNGGAVE